MSQSGSSRQNVCVTGGAGFIGSHLVEAFLAAGWEVSVIDDLSGGPRANVADGARLIEVDIRSAEAARWIEESRPRLLVHHAAQMDVRRSVADPGFDADVNIRGTLNLLEACVKANVQQVLFASTGGAIYGEQDTYPADESHALRPISPYGISKLAVERYLYYYQHAYGLDATCLRYANVYGERQNPHGEAGVVAIFLSKLLAGETPTINGDGLQTRDYVHVSDVVKANLAAVGQAGFQVINVGTGVETTVVELYGQLASALGVERPALHGDGKPGEQRRSVIDPSLLLERLDVGTPLGLAEGFKRTAAWFEERARG